MTPPMPESAEGFDLVLADPPWRYSFSVSTSRRVENHYPTMRAGAIDDLGARLPLAKDCVLLLWATAPKLPEALGVMRAWGFEYKTCAVWDKERIGMGYWFRGQHELLLVGTRGTVRCPVPADRVSSVFREVRRRHSAKPLCVRAWIDKAFPSARKLELFARESAEGWVAWGFEAPKTKEVCNEC